MNDQNADLEYELLTEIMRLVSKSKYVDDGVQLNLYHGRDYRWRCDILIGGNVQCHITLSEIDDYHTACELLKDTTS